MAKSHHKYTDAEKQWLIENSDKFTYKELTEKFNDIFNANVSESNILYFCNKHLNIHKRKKFKTDAENFTFKITKQTIICNPQNTNYIDKKLLRKYISKGKFNNLKITYSNGNLIKGVMQLHINMKTIKIRFDVLSNIARRITYY